MFHSEGSFSLTRMHKTNLNIRTVNFSEELLRFAFTFMCNVALIVHNIQDFLYFFYKCIWRWYVFPKRKTFFTPYTFYKLQKNNGQENKNFYFLSTLEKGLNSSIRNSFSFYNLVKSSGLNIGHNTVDCRKVMAQHKITRKWGREIYPFPFWNKKKIVFF